MNIPKPINKIYQYYQKILTNLINLLNNKYDKSCKQVFKILIVNIILSLRGRPRFSQRAPKAILGYTIAPASKTFGAL